MKKIFYTLLIFCTLFLSSCNVFKELKEGMNNALKTSQDFCEALSNDNYDLASEYLHPDSTPNKTSLESYISNLEVKNDIDFSNGVKFKRRYSFSSTYYDSAYDGSVHELGYELVIGTDNVNFFFTVVSNDIGYGIYNFGIE